jgi:hypothetical protein
MGKAVIQRSGAECGNIFGDLISQRRNRLNIEQRGRPIRTNYIIASVKPPELPPSSR